jgi:hypothetical protein
VLRVVINEKEGFMRSVLRLIGVGAAALTVLVGASVSASAAPNAATQSHVSTRTLSSANSVVSNIDIVDCNARSDFTEIFFGSGLDVVCFANAGEWDGEIDGVWAIRTGNNAGRFIIENSNGDFVQLFGKFQTFSFSTPVKVLQVHIN